MNDLYKYLIGTAAGIILCLLIWGGYTLLSGNNKEQNSVFVARDTQETGNAGRGGGLSSDILGNNPSLEFENYDGELTAEQQERLFAAQVANESLAKRYDGGAVREGGSSGAGLQDASGSRNNERETALDDIFATGALASNSRLQERAGGQDSGNQQIEAQRREVRDAIVQGKNAAQKNQLADALAAFENAAAAMPDDKDFEASSYQDIASSLFLLSKTAPDEQTAQTARDEAERYIKKSLASRNNTDARGLYAAIIEEQTKAAEAKKQQTLLAQQQAADRARKDEQTERQRRQVVELIGQGKNAASKRQLSTAVSAFDKASAAMPDSVQFARESYTEMADETLKLSQRLSQPAQVRTALDKAETYIKRALAVENSADARNLYAKILDARKEQEQLAQKQAEAQRKQQQEQAAQAAAQKQAEEQRKQQEQQLAQQQKAEAQRKQQEQAAQAAAQKRAEEQRKQQGQQLAQQQKAEAQRKQQEQAAQAAAQKQAEEQRKQQEQQLAQQQKAEAQRKQQEQAAQAAAPKSAATQDEKPKTQGHKQVDTLIAQGRSAAQRKQLNNAILAFDRAGRIMPKDNDFAAESYNKMAQAMLELAEGSTNRQTQQNALKKADEYAKKALAAKNTPEGRALAAKIAEKQAAIQPAVAANSGRSSAGTQATTRSSGTANTQAAARSSGTANTQAATRTGSAANAQAANTQAAAQTEAAKKAQAELQAKKREVDTLVQQGKKAGAAGNFTEAQNAFSKAASIMPSGDNTFAAEQYREMADTMLSLSKSAPAHKDQALKSGAEYSKRAIAAQNNDGKTHFVYAQIADAQNNPALALQELEAARRFDPKNYLYNYELGRKYFEQKKYTQARTCFEQAVNSNPQYEAAFFNLGITHKIMNANDAALTAFSKAAALKPDYVRAWVEMARVQDKKRNYTQAINNYQKALSLEPSNISALKEMAQVYSKMKDSKQAERYFKEAVALGDTDPVTYYNLATVQLEAGRASDALQNAEKAVAGNKKDARFLYTYALSLEKNNRLKEAEDYYAQSVAADGKYGKPRINLGRIQLEAGNLESAEQHLLAAYGAEPSNFEVNMNLGKLYGLKTQYGKAIDYYANAIKIMPKDIDARQNLAAVYLSAGLKEKARDTYQAIIKMNGQAWDSYYELGKVYISMDNKAEAKAVFEQLLKQKANYRYAAEIRRLLGNL